MKTQSTTATAPRPFRFFFFHLTIVLCCQHRSLAFFIQPSIHSTSSSSTTTRLYVFDFFKQRSKEGLDQLSNLAEASRTGQLGKGLLDAATYTQTTNRAFAQGLAKSRNRFLQNLETLFTGTSPEDIIEELEDVLLMADLGTATTEDIVEEVKSLRDDSSQLLRRDDLMSIMRGKLIEALPTDGSAIQFSKDESKPTVLLIMGANGMGKTTTIGKLAHRLRTEGNQTVLLAACDTFRAGAVEQLELWAERAEVDLVGPDEQAKVPSSILHKALSKAMAEKYDTLLVDTSGRLSNNYALTDDLIRMKRVIQKLMSVENDDNGKPILNDQVPHETLLVLDAAQGRMALDSAKVWNEEVGLTGLILTKLDGSARGGSVVAVSRDLGLPVKLIGVGEGIEDLRDFEPERFVDSLLGIGQFGGSGSKKNEGDILAARLTELRQERDSKAKLRRDVTPVTAAVSEPKINNVAAVTSPSQLPPRPPNPNRRKNSSKKKKGKR